MALRWKKEPPETGLRRVGAGPRSSWLHDGKTKFATVSAKRQNFGSYSGWYWVAGWDSGAPHKNTCNEPCETEQEAKAQAMAYVKAHLKGGAA